MRIELDATASITFDHINSENVMMEIIDCDLNHHTLWVKHSILTHMPEKVEHAVWDYQGNFLDKDEYESYLLGDKRTWVEVMPPWLCSVVGYITDTYESKEDMFIIKHNLEKVQALVNATFTERS